MVIFMPSNNKNFQIAIANIIKGDIDISVLLLNSVGQYISKIWNLKGIKL